MLDRFVAEIGLDRAGIDALIRQLEPAGMAEHVRVNLHIEASGLVSTLQHGLKAPLRERRHALADKYEGRFGLAL